MRRPLARRGTLNWQTESAASGQLSPTGYGGPLLQVSDLQVTFRQRAGAVRAVAGLSYSLDEGKTMAIIGESGSGKTVSARAVMGLLPPSAMIAGSVVLAGRELVGRSERELRAVRGRDVAMVFQNPEKSLNPTMRIGQQIAEGIRAHQEVGREQARTLAVELLDRVRIPAAARRFHDYPHQLSGGMRQRVMIALALACSPKLLIADEATTALDVTTQAQIMSLLAELQRESNMALIMISHDLGLAASYAEEVIVMYAGRAVEQAPIRELFRNVMMPYTEVLLNAIPRLDAPVHSTLPTVEGRPPDLASPMSGCAFEPRCPARQGDCQFSRPELLELRPGHRVACWHPGGG